MGRPRGAGGDQHRPADPLMGIPPRKLAERLNRSKNLAPSRRKPRVAEDEVAERDGGPLGELMAAVEKFQAETGDKVTVKIKPGKKG